MGYLSLCLNSKMSALADLFFASVSHLNVSALRYGETQRQSPYYPQLELNGNIP